LEIEPGFFSLGGVSFITSRCATTRQALVATLHGVLAEAGRAPRVLAKGQNVALLRDAPGGHACPGLRCASRHQSGLLHARRPAQEGCAGGCGNPSSLLKKSFCEALGV